MKLKKCLLMIDNHLTENQKEEIKKTDKFSLIRYNGLLMWIRNNCDLWTYGTKDVENDVYLLIENGYYLDQMMNLLKEKMISRYIDINYDLSHPGNCSHVILDAYQDFLLDKLPINLLD